ncbi:hypothetical protein BCE75_101258 [Isoptericola sp. CG 20/1183]|uniref:Uncharacterized protein n=1 Tax=Isoptericola halotolerans TaxID=300560 RepID=A0ABX5EGK1_9MICO|nr:MULTISPECIES: hypothetical protein [Isoptericola]PRZ08622.1 hypothetical protein BCL65_102164 [Isoptericola halotolerans]PRZ10931.1 hypothetical protein BCE75_101258 [Isoptericola sp. CG 20/1183]
MNGLIEWSALGQVVVAGLLIGAGIPALFALGLRLVAGTSETPEAPERSSGTPRETKGPVVIARPSPARLVGALLCFGTVVGAVGAGLVFLAAGGHS